MNYRKGKLEDVNKIKSLGIKAWTEFKSELTPENWILLKNSINNDDTYMSLLKTSESFICENEDGRIIGMSFLVPSGNPTEIFDKNWSYIRFVSVDPDFGGLGIGQKLTEKCIEYAKEKGERTIALHTSEIMKKAIHIYEKIGFKLLKEIHPRLGKKYYLYLLQL